MSDPISSAAFVWKDDSRFVAVAPVVHGWLVFWGRYRDLGQHRLLAGNRTYRDLAGARRRVADTVFELTRDPALVDAALVRFGRAASPPHPLTTLPEPL
jgi:hypothetical protein